MTLKKPSLKEAIVYSLIIISLLAFMLCLPSKLFNKPKSTIILSQKGEIIGARIASDGQWRFPETQIMSPKFSEAIIAFEDAYFYFHPGVNIISTLKALYYNIREGRIVSGASTISMQVIRISKQAKRRSYIGKLQEMIMAISLECSFSKKEILSLYAANAPFGGNIVGLEAASWRYFGRPAKDLSWAEAACLAVLPNSPSIIYPGKNNPKLKHKRDKLLLKLYHTNIIDYRTYQLSILEDLPGKVHSLSRINPHLLLQAEKKYKGTIVKTNINLDLQKQLNAIIKTHQQILEANHIYNAAAIIAEVSTGKVIAYVGNTRAIGKINHANKVDICFAPRSSGSILKPFLYTAMLNKGDILANTLIYDIPTQISGYSPKNYSLSFDGAVGAGKALSRSLNVPMVRMLRTYGVEKFHFLLKKLGMKTLNFPSNHYGLSLILGGAETRLWDITGMYASLARVLNNYNKYNCYFKEDIHPLNYLFSDNKIEKNKFTNNILNASSIYECFEALSEVNRPLSERAWKSFSSSSKTAWKTGTSFGFRDAWSVGVNSKYVVGVWCGNANGIGRPALLGVGVAAPIMFDILNILPSSEWFDQPFEEMSNIKTCRESGYKANKYCPEKDLLWISNTGFKTNKCPFHKLINLNRDSTYRVNSKCEDINNMVRKVYFSLPPIQEWYYKRKHPLYQSLPPMHPKCIDESNKQIMEFIYPKEANRLFIPKLLDGSRGSIIFEIIHKQTQEVLYWHMDGKYLGETSTIHQMRLAPNIGKHKLSVNDSKGNIIVKSFSIVSKDTKHIY